VLDEQSAFSDYIAQLCRELTRPDVGDVDLDEAHVTLAPHARLLQTRWAWSTLGDGRVATPPADEEFFVVRRDGDEVRLKSLTTLQAIILAAMEEPTTLRDIEATVLASVDPDPSVASEMPAYVRELVRDALDSGLADIVATSTT
jgi:hypothetical protein